MSEQFRDQNYKILKILDDQLRNHHNIIAIKLLHQMNLLSVQCPGSTHIFGIETFLKCSSLKIQNQPNSYFMSSVHREQSETAITDAALGQLYSKANSPKHPPDSYFITSPILFTHADTVPFSKQ